MLFDDELTAQRNHEEYAQPAADEGQQKDARVFQIEAEEDQRRQGEDDAGGNGLAGVAGGLHDVVFEDGRTAEGAQDADGEDRDGNGGGDGEPGSEAHIDGDSAKDDAEEGSKQEGAECEFGPIFGGRNEGLKFRHEGLRMLGIRFAVIP